MSNRAVIDFAAVIVAEHVLPLGLGQLVQLTKELPAAGVAVKVTLVPFV